MKLSKRLSHSSSALARWKTFNAKNKLNSPPIGLRHWIGELLDAQSFIPTTREYSDAGIAANPVELARLRHLKELGLAKRHAADSWLVRSDFIGQLQQMKDVQDRARTLFAAALLSATLMRRWNSHTSSKKLIGRVLLNSEDERTGSLQTIFETTEGKIEVIRHRWHPAGSWRRGDLEPGNVVTIDSLRSDPSKLYAASVGADKEILANKQALDSVARRMRTMGLVSSETDKGWMGQFNNALRARVAERTQERGH